MSNTNVTMVTLNNVYEELQRLHQELGFTRDAAKLNSEHSIRMFGRESAIAIDCHATYGWCGLVNEHLERMLQVLARPVPPATVPPPRETKRAVSWKHDEHQAKKQVLPGYQPGSAPPYQPGSAKRSVSDNEIGPFEPRPRFHAHYQAYHPNPVYMQQPLLAMPGVFNVPRGHMQQTGFVGR